MNSTPDQDHPAFQPQGQHSYASGPQGYPPVPPPPRRGGRNPLSIAAFVVASLGFLFAVIEGAYLLGWILLPIGFILSIVALVQRDQRKGMALGALGVTIVGTLAGVLAFTMTVGRAFDSAFGGTAPTLAAAAGPSGLWTPGMRPSTGGDAPTAASADATASAPAAATTTAAAPASGQGTRENPYPLKATVATDTWKVTVNSFTADATKAVLAANSFNDKPPAGMAYALINVTLTYTGAEKATSLEVSTHFVTSSGNVITTSDGFAVAPKALSIKEMYTGASVTGNVCLLIPKGDQGLIRITPGLFADEVFFALS